MLALCCSHFDATEHPTATDHNRQDTVVQVFGPVGGDRFRVDPRMDGPEVLSDECVFQCRWSDASLDAANGLLDMLFDIKGNRYLVDQNMLLRCHAEELWSGAIAPRLEGCPDGADQFDGER